MILRTDHIAGAFFVGVGLLVIALSGDLPVGSMSSPGAGFLPNIVAVLTLGFGVILMLRAAESETLTKLDWSDLTHAAMVIFAVGAAATLFLWLGYLITMALMMFGLLVIVERRKALPAAAYSLSVVTVTYLIFEYVLKAPLVRGPFGY
jgi:hypothetical protein